MRGRELNPNEFRNFCSFVCGDWIICWFTGADPNIVCNVDIGVGWRKEGWGNCEAVVTNGELLPFCVGWEEEGDWTFCELWAPWLTWLLNKEDSEKFEGNVGNIADYYYYSFSVRVKIFREWKNDNIIYMTIKL